MNEGYLGKFEFKGERAATDDHPAILNYLPLDASVTAKVEVGTLLKAVEVKEGGVVKDVAYAPLLSTDADAAPVAVADLPCDPTGDKPETSVCAVVHGTVKTRLLRTGDGEAPSAAQLAALARSGVFPA